jgi:assimilatory nitrate reductase catalytic subunit
VHSKPRFLQGVYGFEGEGLSKHSLLSTELTYTVPPGVTTQLVYFRGGNSCGELVAVVLVRDGVPMRYFPVGAKGDMHVPLRVVEDLDGGSVIEVHVSAPEGVSGSLVVDLGLVEV